ncbi:MAG: Cupredoxin-like domain [Actinomycetota bacterium]
MRTVRRSGVLFVVVAALGIAACGSSGSYGGSGATATTAGGAVTTGGGAAAGAGGATIANFSFSSSGTLTAGTAFTVTNNDSVTHTFTNPDGAFDVKVPGGGTAQVTVAAAGTYTVVCKIHTQMKGSITVG